MQIPEKENSIQNLIYKKYEIQQEAPRLHLGASTLGHACDRWLWLSFRWALIEKFPGRIIRLFKRGQDAELKIVTELRGVGLVLQDTGANQRRVSFGSHVSGSLDGVIKAGVPGAEEKMHILEIKTHSKKSFDDLEKNGVEKSKPEHFVQMQVYMHGTKIDRALYFAECKDDDRIYTERVRYSKEVAEKAIERGKRIALADRMPPPISTDPTWYQCKFCPASSFCHETKKTKEVNCRTCARATAKDDNTWYCEKWEATIPADQQRVGCESHVLHPDLVPWQINTKESTQDVAAYVVDGKTYLNGPGHIKSREILVDSFSRPEIQAVRKAFDGEVIC